MTNLNEINRNSFLKNCKNYYNDKEIKLFEKAIDFIKPELSEKKRLAGDTFFEHNLRVGLILVENKSTPETVVAGLLHGVEDKNLQKEFGKEIVDLIKGLDQIKEIKNKNQQLEAQALRKILITTVRDMRIIIVKLANKLDNIASTNALPESKQKRVAEEVIEFYAPLAYRLGMEKIRVPLENLAFKIINPRKYNEISKFLNESREQREKDVHETIEKIKRLAKSKVKILKIKGRSKHIYSIYKKIKNRKVNLSEQYDLLGIRVILENVKDCYSLLGMLHENFVPIDDRLKDYIANPKPNFYRSIHTALEISKNKKAEIQIRTPEMDEFAEEGVAAHWKYKGGNSSEFFEKKVSWLRSILDLQKKSADKEFLETAKIDIFGDHIYCYTPKGDLKELPKGSTILDFGFLIHEQVGAKTIGARVNGKFVPLRHELKQGDIVEIITNKNQRPRRSWIKIVKSGKVRQKIRKFVRKYEKLPALHYRKLKPVVEEEKGLLVESEEFPAATCNLAKCCFPIPGEDIVGIITKKKIISVHKESCHQAIKEQSRWVPVNWKETFNQKIQFRVTAKERSGLLADLLNTIATAGFEVKEAKAKLIDMQHSECAFAVIPRSLDHLKELVKRVMKVKGIDHIYFD